MRRYLRYIGPALKTWALGIAWLWTRQISRWVEIDTHQPPIFVPQLRFQRQHQHGIVLNIEHLIRYKPGWGPLWPRPFLLVYLTTYLAGTIAGYGVVSLSRAWYERSQKIRMADGKVLTPVTPGLYFRGEKWAHPFARFMTRLLDWAFPGSAHGRHTGPRLWGVEGIR